HQHLWSTANLTSRLSGFFASKLMKSRTVALEPHERPRVFQHQDFKGQVYQLDEPVLDTASLVQALAVPQQDAIFSCDAHSLQLRDNGSGVDIAWQHRAQTYRLTARKIIMCAGAGNAALVQQLGLSQPQMQLRPLHMVMLRGMAEPLYAHCLGASTVPRLTITAHPDGDAGWVWYLGGQLAEEGVARSAAEQIRAAQAELADLLPWLELSAAQWATLRIDRAEPRQQGEQRPDTAFVQQQGNAIITWPTKLALSPLLAAEVEQLIEHVGLAPATTAPLALSEFPAYARLPWQEVQAWS
ncbi:MAG: FAD-dependent oxidoreductase, partial [Gammaproteobacteria bacterium]